jgi:hypothetical protein
METEVRLKNVGLRGVRVADSKISYIDGEKGILIYRGLRFSKGSLGKCTISVLEVDNDVLGIGFLHAAVNERFRFSQSPGQFRGCQ